VKRKKKEEPQGSIASCIDHKKSSSDGTSAGSPSLIERRKERKEGPVPAGAMVNIRSQRGTGRIKKKKTTIKEDR